MWLPRLALALAASVLLVSCAGSKPREPLGFFETVPAFELVAHTGQPFRSEAELKGKVWIADFVFTNCTGPCPRMGTQMRQVQKALAGVNGIRLVSFTVDPKRDTPEVLAAYAKRYQAEPGRWFFLTGSKETLNDLSFRVFHLATITEQLDHSTRFTLIDRRGRIRKYYDTTSPDGIAELIADARDLAAANES